MVSVAEQQRFSFPCGEDNCFQSAIASLGIGVLGAALSLLVIQRGGQLDVTPGNEIRVTLNGRLVKPFLVAPLLKKGDITAETWASECKELGIAGADLGSVVSKKAGTTVSNT
jgi:hypothetical protein